MPPEISEFLKTVWNLIQPILDYVWLFIKTWWWVPLPFILWKPARYFWLFWRIEKWITRQKRILLEIKIPEESLKPIRAMEDVFTGLWQGFYDPPNWYEKWWEGKIILGFQLETVSINGEVHFYIRCPDYRRDIVETHIYSQYPEDEITLAEDYTRYVPQDMPNKDWDLWATDYMLEKPDPYPIKTYKDFETEAESEEEKRIDPVASLLESMAKIKPGEQLWVQIHAYPISEEYAESFFKEGLALKDKLAKRPEAPEPKPMIQEAAEILITGKPAEEEEPPSFELVAPELRLTPGEKEIIVGVERKISKPPFKCSMRFIYLGKREVWFKANLRLAIAFFGHYVTEHLNAPFPLGRTITKIKRNWYNWFWFIDRRLYLRRRKLLRQYRERFNPMFPRAADRKTGEFILNTEELASLYHFPSRAVAPAPTVPRVEAKKGEAPPELPVE